MQYALRKPQKSVEIDLFSAIDSVMLLLVEMLNKKQMKQTKQTNKNPAKKLMQSNKDIIKNCAAKCGRLALSFEQNYLEEQMRTEDRLISKPESN